MRATSPRRRIYLPYVATNTGFTSPTRLRFAIRTTGDPAQLIAPVRAAVAAVDPLLPIASVEPLAALMRESIRYERLTMQLGSALSVLALFLASIGVYATVAYAVARRTGEIGLRCALGARTADVLRLVLRGALQTVGIGMLLGVLAALAMGRVLESQLFGVPAIDWPSLALALGILGASAALAAIVPAVLATRVSPLSALRTE